MNLFTLTLVDIASAQSLSSLGPEVKDFSNGNRTVSSTSGSGDGSSRLEDFASSYTSSISTIVSCLKSLPSVSEDSYVLDVLDSLYDLGYEVDTELDDSIVGEMKSFPPSYGDNIKGTIENIANIGAATQRLLEALVDKAEDFEHYNASGDVTEDIWFLGEFIADAEDQIFSDLPLSDLDSDLGESITDIVSSHQSMFKSASFHFSELPSIHFWPAPNGLGENVPSISLSSSGASLDTTTEALSTSTEKASSSSLSAASSEPSSTYSTQISDKATKLASSCGLLGAFLLLIL